MKGNKDNVEANDEDKTIKADNESKQDIGKHFPSQEEKGQVTTGIQKIRIAPL